MNRKLNEIAAHYSSSSYPLLLIGGLSSVIVFRMICTELGGLQSNTFCEILVRISDLLKLLTLISIPLVFTTVYSSVYKKPRVAVLAFCRYAVISLLLISLLILAKALHVKILSNGEVWCFSPFAIGSNPHIGLTYVDELVSRWSFVELLIAEIGLAFLLAGLHCIIGLVIGPKFFAVPFGMVLSLALLAMHFYIFEFFIWDFDKFHVDLFSGALLFGLFLPIEGDFDAPYTVICSIVYIGTLYSSISIVRGLFKFNVRTKN